MASLQAALCAKGEQFSHVIKMGRTRLQDAVPNDTWPGIHRLRAMINQACSHIDDAAHDLLDISLDSTAIGIG
jgi:aspartate ammonia-lyase